MTREEAIGFWAGLRKTFSSQLEKEENHFRRMHLQTSIDAIDTAISALRQQETVAKCNDLYDEDGGEVLPKNERTGPMPLEELRKMDAPVWLRCYQVDGDGYWCLCKNGIIITPAGNRYDVSEIPHWAFYRQKPEEGQG